MPAELSPRSRTSLPPASRPASGAPPVIASDLLSFDPPIIQLTISGRLTLQAIQSSRGFGQVVRSLGGKPYRVLCDVTQTLTMPEDVCAVFMRGQEFAVERGMERDAFVCTSSVLRLQFVRIARESGRFDRLGPIQFFDSVEQARAYLETPFSETHVISSPRRWLDHEQGVVSRRAPAADAADGAPSRRGAAIDYGHGAASRRAPVLDVGDARPSRRPPPVSLRAAVPLRHHNRG